VISSVKLRFTIRDLLWSILVVVLVVGWWLDHRYVCRQLKYCYDQLLETEEELAAAQKEVEDGHRAAFAADREIQRLHRESAINAERPLPTPGPFIRP